MGRTITLPLKKAFSRKAKYQSELRKKQIGVSNHRTSIIDSSFTSETIERFDNDNKKSIVIVCCLLIVFLFFLFLIISQNYMK